MSSFQITVLKVLAGHPDGRATVPEVTHYVSFLMNSGSDWTDRMKRLTARAPGLNIFSSAFVLRESSGWQITDAGREFLTELEKPTATAAQVQERPAEPSAPPPRQPILRLVVDNTIDPKTDREPDDAQRISYLFG